MSILHRRRVARDRNAELAAGGKRKSAPVEYPRASKSKPVSADVKACTWRDPEAVAADAAAAAVKKPAKKKTARRK